MPFRIALLLPLAALLAALFVPLFAQETPRAQTAAASPSPWKTVAVIPWGSGAGKLAEAIRSKEADIVFRGPTCMIALDGGGFAILDTLSNVIEEFDSSGKATRELPFPAAGADKKPTEGCDMAASGPGEYWVLSAGRNVILHVKAGGATTELAVPGVRKDSILTAISRDKDGTLYVLDGYDSSLFRIDQSGKGLPKLSHKQLQGMALDSNGHVYDLRLSSREDARHLDLVRWSVNAAAGRQTTSPEPGFEGLEGSASMSSQVVARIVSDREVVRMDVFGVDSSGNIYVTMASGAIEKPSKSEIVRFDSAGQETGRVAAVQDPIELKFTHGKAVAGNGTVFALAVRQNGLVVMKLESF